jgi:peptidyl-prolyl cis-trans isomerase SurA
MTKHMLSMVLATVVSLGLFSQGSPVLLTIGDEEVSLAEFERIYRKNNNENSLNRQSPEEYLDLFIKFRLKVLEAESLGMDTTRKFIDELEGYREQLAKPYLVDEESKEELLQEAYERSKLDINVSQILIKLPAAPTPDDTLAAFEKISEIRERIVNGEDFEAVARATSDDASVGRTGGNLGYITVFSIIYPFETMAYTVPVGEVSPPFRSNYGYHILKVHDRRPAVGQVKVAHIFVRTPEGMTEAQRKDAYARAQMIHDSLQAGVDFAHLARTYSEDPSSARNGGEIPWFGTGRMIREFEEACFSLDEPGQYTQPFKSFYGWHIVKLLDKKGIGTFEEMKQELQEKVNRSDRRKYQTDLFVAKLKEENGFEAFPGGLEPVYASADSTLLDGAWEGGGLEKNRTLLARIGDRELSTGDFVQYILKKQNQGVSRHVRSYVDNLFDTYIREEVIAYEDSRLSDKYPEFRYIYQEYHDGILLFDIMDKMVWTKAVSDTAGLEAFHAMHRQDYMWGPRSEGMVIRCSEGADMAGVRKAYKKILKGRLDETALNDAFCTSDTVTCITLEKVLVEEGENELVDNMKGKSGLGPVVQEGDEHVFVILKGVRPAEPKQLNEARGQITSDYQNYLEEQWIEVLRQKYPVKVDRSLLSRIKS